jgi:hypothetical protein
MPSDRTYIVKANCQPDLPADQRLSDQELLDIVNTMLSAGYVDREPPSTIRLTLFSSDTTSLSICWALHYLSINPGVQARLKEELATVPVYTPSQVCGRDEIMAHFDAIDHLPYLDAVMKETIRLSPSVHSTVRVAMTDDEIPLSEEIIMRDGTVEKTFKVKKGQWIHLPLEATSVDRTIWGEDAWEFRQVFGLVLICNTALTILPDPNDGNQSLKRSEYFVVHTPTCYPFLQVPESVSFNYLL